MGKRKREGEKYQKRIRDGEREGASKSERKGRIVARAVNPG
jgi:hypothetical protein